MTSPTPPTPGPSPIPSPKIHDTITTELIYKDHIYEVTFTPPEHFYYEKSDARDLEKKIKEFARSFFETLDKEKPIEKDKPIEAKIEVSCDLTSTHINIENLQVAETSPTSSEPFIKDDAKMIATKNTVRGLIEPIIKQLHHELAVSLTPPAPPPPSPRNPTQWVYHVSDTANRVVGDTLAINGPLTSDFMTCQNGIIEKLINSFNTEDKARLRSFELRYKLSDKDPLTIKALLDNPTASAIEEKVFTSSDISSLGIAIDDSFSLTTLDAMGDAIELKEYNINAGIFTEEEYNNFLEGQSDKLQIQNTENHITYCLENNEAKATFKNIQLISETLTGPSSEMALRDLNPKDLDTKEHLTKLFNKAKQVVPLEVMSNLQKVSLIFEKKKEGADFLEGANLSIAYELKTGERYVFNLFNEKTCTEHPLIENLRDEILEDLKSEELKLLVNEAITTKPLENESRRLLEADVDELIDF